MAKKKYSQKNVATVKEFSSSPFKRLKGLSAFAAAPAVKKSSPKEVTAARQEAVKVADEYSSFAEEMDFLGVKPLPGATIEEAEAIESPEAKESAAVVVPKKSRQESDETAFLAAVGLMDKTFKDDWQEETVAKAAAPRRMRQVARGQLRVDAELDLHGLIVEEALAKTRFFLQDALYQGFQTLLLITGKGLHSSEGPVLRQAVEALLGQSSAQVVEWGVAPRRLGGDGALVVFLRKQTD